jgi:hypothetical protein
MIALRISAGLTMFAATTAFAADKMPMFVGKQ